MHKMWDDCAVRTRSTLSTLLLILLTLLTLLTLLSLLTLLTRLTLLNLPSFQVEDNYHEIINMASMQTLISDKLRTFLTQHCTAQSQHVTSIALRPLRRARQRLESKVFVRQGRKCQRTREHYGQHGTDGGDQRHQGL